ncbi:hypothetical protein HN766_06340 [Candidatus Poribacteria bacterium]|nr:hypothetical protein [Candidatus Poribacteria bacterium]
MRIRTIAQSDLHHIGCGENGKYEGYKWGIFLRAPEVFSELLRRGQGTFVPLASVAQVSRGITSGCDDFFYPRDITDRVLADTHDPATLLSEYGILPEKAADVRIVQAGDGSTHLMEARCLQPLVFNLMDVERIEIEATSLKRCVFMPHASKAELRGTHALRYVRWGESEGFHERPTCASRPLWYDLTYQRPSDVLWTKSQQYRHVAPLNEDDHVANCNLYDVSGEEGVDPAALAAILNSTIVAFMKHYFGRYSGREGALKTEVGDVNRMLVPDPRRATGQVHARLTAALDSLRARTVGHLVDVDSDRPGPSGELAHPPRQRLDDAVLELLGVDDAQEREALRRALYDEVTSLLRDTRRTEKQMQKHRSKSSRKGRPTARTMAAEIWPELADIVDSNTPLDYIPRDAETSVVDVPAGTIARVREASLLDPTHVDVKGVTAEVSHVAQGRLVKLLVESGCSGLLEVPADEATCTTVVAEYGLYVDEVERLLHEHASAYTNRENEQARIVRELWRLLRAA